MPEEYTPSWKSFLFAMGGAYGIFLCIYLCGRAGIETFDTVVFGIWGGCFWVGGMTNLFVDRIVARRKREDG